MVQKISPHRRRSVSVLNPSMAAPSAQQSRRRAYSIAPGEKLSPAAKARRVMVPRKSILKGSVNVPQDSPDASAADETNATQTMDFTEIQSHTSRKSLGRRVSFASRAHVRLFKVQNKNGDPSSSPESSSGQDNDVLNDENAHSAQGNSDTRRRSSIRRRSSVAFSEFGEQSMDMDMDDTAPAPLEFINKFQSDQYAEDEDEEYDDIDDGEDMDMTEAILQNIIRKRALSLGGPGSSLPVRRRSSVSVIATSSHSQSENQFLSRHEDQDENDVQSSEHDQDATSSTVITEGSSGENTHPMEFTIPLNRSLRAPAQQDPVYQQLCAATHAGANNDPIPEFSDDDPGSNNIAPFDDGDTGEAMELTEAIGRLQKARASFGLSQADGSLYPPIPDLDGDAEKQDIQNDTFSSSEDSFNSDILGNGSGDQTINVTAMIRNSVGGSESSMDVTGVYEGDGRNEEHEDEVAINRPVQALTFPPKSIQSSDQNTKPSVFSAPGQPSVFTAPRVFTAPTAAQPSSTPRSPMKPPASATIPRPFTFSLPARTKLPRSTHETTPASPSKIPLTKGSAAFAPPTIPKSPKKRPAPDDADAELESRDKPSPPKKQATGKFSPAKKVASIDLLGSGPSTTRLNRRASAVRRPSGYFAQRKSLGGNLTHPDLPQGPQKLVAPTAKHGRASLGSASASGVSRAPLYPDVSTIAEEDDAPIPARSQSPTTPASASLYPTIDAQREEETLHQILAVPSPTRGSPSPAPCPRVASPSPGSGGAAPVKSLTVATQSTVARSISPIERRVSIASSPAAQNIPIDEPVAGISTRQDEAMVDDVGREEEMESTEPISAEQWRDGVQGEETGDDGPQISIEQFFEMTGIRFMDEITAPRRSSLHPAHFHQHSRRRSLNASQSEELEDIPLAEFVTALSVELPQLELYSTIAGELNAWIEESRKICRQADEEAIKVTPGLFREFADVDDSEKEFLLHQLKLIKANNHGTAKSQWYDWKKDWVEQLQATAEGAFFDLESDAKILEDIVKQAQNMLPALREEFAHVMNELEQEQVAIAEVDSQDQDYLNELKASIAEQDAEIEVFQAEVSEATAKLERLEEKLTEIESQKQEATAGISQGQHIIHIQKESTSAEVFRLKDELEALQDLHLFKCTKIKADLVEFIYASRYQISIPCIKYKPVVSELQISRMKNARLKERDAFPQLTQLMLESARLLVVNSSNEMATQRIVQCLGDFWSSCAQLRSQFTFLSIKYPLTMELIPPMDKDTLSSFKVTATVLFSSVKSKAYISFMLDSYTYSQWPMSIGSLKADVSIAYGRIEREVILNAVRGRLAQASSSDNHGCLLDACIEASEQY